MDENRSWTGSSGKDRHHQQLEQWLNCSVMTVRRRLKAWRSFTSINQTAVTTHCPRCPSLIQRVMAPSAGAFFKAWQFEANRGGVITSSSKGLSAVEIARLLIWHPTALSYRVLPTGSVSSAKNTRDGLYIFQNVPRFTAFRVRPGQWPPRSRHANGSRGGDDFS